MNATKQKTAAAFNRVLGRAVGALSDSIKTRREELMDVLTVMPAKHPLREEVHAMLMMLEAQDSKQARLSLEFQNANTQAK